MAYVSSLDGCEPHLAEVVGGKAVGLGALMRESLQVPSGFAIGTHAYREFVSETGLDHALHELLADADTLETQAEASQLIRRLFEERELQAALRVELVESYCGLGEPPVAVRSSAVSEDATDASFAGEHETSLWIQGIESLERAVLRCWASLFTPQALAYFRRVDIRADETAMGVVVQTMVPAEAAGVMLTLDPVTGDRSQITIEASFGLGEAVVGGEVTPDRYAVDKVTLELRSSVLSSKHIAYHFDPALGEVRLVDVPIIERELPSISNDEAIVIASLGKRIERALGAPQDIEWAIGPARDVHLLQTRPETVWSRKGGNARTAPASTVAGSIAQPHARRLQSPEAE